jgi:glycosyltransferase involved in cell wall biosynthesis
LHEVLIVSDGSTDSTAAVIEAFHGRLPIRLVSLPKGTVSIARNAGLRLATAPIIVFLDDDVVPSARFLAEHVRFHREFPEQQEVLLGYVTWSPELHVTPFMRWYGEYGALFGYSLIQDEATVSYMFLWTPNLSVKREFALQVGGFNETLTVHEDYEFGFRMSRAGMRLHFRHSALGYHYQTFTFEQACLRSQRYSGNLAPFLLTEAGRELSKKESGLVRRIVTPIACVAAAILSPLLRVIDSDTALPKPVYRLLYWQHANRLHRAGVRR